jgi:translation initiation factor 2B subunit (eIF-2B alpha/beta/delta family)
MILEQRFGAAQVAMRAADILLQRASTGQAASPDTFRRELFRTGWQLISEQHAVGSLVNLLDSLLWALESAETPQELHAATQHVIDTYRHQLTQRVFDSAAHSLSVLAPCRRIVIHGYSTTVQYALQHALRSGQRVDVDCIDDGNAVNHEALRNRIAAIGLQVESVGINDLTSRMSNYDAVVVGADTLDMHGLANSDGTRQLAALANRDSVPFFAFCTSEKFLPNVFYTAPVHTIPFDESLSASHAIRHTIDRTPIEHISAVITERGPLPAPAVVAWLATTQLHPWLIGRGRALTTPT